MEWMRKFMLLAGPAGGIGHRAAGGWGGKGDRGRQVVGLHGAGGVYRRLFGAGVGPAEAVAEAKQERVNPSRSICNTICNSRAPFGYYWATVALRSAS